MKGIRRNEVCRMDVEKRGGKLVKFLESWATKEREDKSAGKRERWKMEHRRRRLCTKSDGVLVVHENRVEKENGRKAAVLLLLMLSS